jgi:hypothetical protein
MMPGVIGLILAVAVGIIVGLARRGSFANLSRTHLAGVPLVFTGVVLQVGSTIAERAEITWLPLTLVLGSFALTFGFAALNRRLPGMMLIATGALMNFTVIAVNGGMPVSIDALDRAGIGNPFERGEVTKGAHHALDDDEDRLTFLADVLPIKVTANVVSAGDVVIWAGLLLAIQQLMVGRPGKRRRGAGERDRELTRG